MIKSILARLDLKRNSPPFLFVFIMVASLGGTGFAAYANATEGSQSMHTAYVAEYTDFGETEPAEALLVDRKGNEYRVEFDLNDYVGYVQSWSEAESTSKEIAQKFKDARGKCVAYVQKGKLWKKRIMQVPVAVPCRDPR